MTDAGTTIAAVATPVGVGAISLIRVSGPAALEVLRSTTDRPYWSPPPRRQCLVRIMKDGETLDEALVTWFPGPASYTGEDLVEIGCHGGVLVTRGVLLRLLESGCDAAAPGEFTRRAFSTEKWILPKRKP